MKFQTKTSKEITSDTVISFIYEDKENKSPLFEYLNELSNNEIKKQLKLGIIKGKYLETFKIAINENLKVLLMGLGKSKELTRKKFSIAVSSAARSAKTISLNNSIAIELIDYSGEKDSFDKKESAIITIPAARIGLYNFDKYLSNKKPSIETLEIIEDD